MLRTTVWLVLIFGGVLTVILALVLLPAPLAIAVAVVTVGSWVSWGFWSAHLFGIRRHVARHLGPNWTKGEVIHHRVRTGERVELQAALDLLKAREVEGPAVFGLPSLHLYSTADEEVPPGDLVQLINNNPEPVPLLWEALPRSTGQTLKCAGNALYLLRPCGKPVCAYVQGRTRGPRKQALLQVLAQSREVAEEALNEVLEVGRRHSAYKGAVLSVQHYDVPFTGMYCANRCGRR
jgi:hypothetical protein